MQTKSIIEYICSWLKDYSKNSKTRGFVIGISGGIDSSVTSTLAAKTGIPLLCVEMPIYQKKSEIERGKNHIKWLKSHFKNVKSIEINLTAVLEKFIDQLPKKINNNKLALANTRARLRMTNLYYLSQINNYIVVGTGNKVEDFGIGFFTKYGDGGVDISPIADLLKTEVYTIGKHLNILNEILIAPPSDGLWDNQKTDEEQIGATYTELEWAMNYKTAKHKLTKKQTKVMSIYKKSNKANQHKMRKIPVCMIPQKLK